MKKITAVIPVREGSQRVPNKNFKPFYKDKSLLELKIESLLEVKTIDNIIVNTDSPLGIKIANKYNISFYHREPYYASSECKGSDFFENLAETTEGDIILHTPCTSPFITPQTYYNIINQYSLTTDHDSINTVFEVKEFLWLNGTPLNYKAKSAPNSQNLPNVQKLTFGCNIIDRNTMIKNKNIVGTNPSFYTVSEIESIDIDTPLDFKFAQYLYNQEK